MAVAFGLGRDFIPAIASLSLIVLNYTHVHVAAVEYMICSIR